jgi:hypothetical protein
MDQGPFGKRKLSLPMNESAFKKAFWRCLLLPISITVLVTTSACLLVSFGNFDHFGGLEYVLLSFLAGPVAGLLCTPWFVVVAKRRYTGRSLVLISIAYPLGQIIATIALFALIVFLFTLPDLMD